MQLLWREITAMETIQLKLWNNHTTHPRGCAGRKKGTMNKIKHTWNIVHDCDGENGEPTCWSKEILHPNYGRFVWIAENTDGGFDVIVDIGTVITCKSLASAKRWVAMNISSVR